MKARIRKTGEIVNIAEYATIALDMCDSYGNPIELKPEDLELIPDVKENNFPKTDWNQVRVQAAIAAMQATMQSQSYLKDIIDVSKQAKMAVEVLIAKNAVIYADRLIEELKKEKE